MGHKRLMRIGVVGGGAMGCGIALELAIAGRQVVLFNRHAKSSDAARVKLERDAALLVDTGMLRAEQHTTALARIRRTTVLAEAAVDQGELGLKTGQGFYPWTPDSAAAFEERMARHLITQLREDRAAGRLPTPESGE